MQRNLKAEWEAEERRERVAARIVFTSMVLIGAHLAWLVLS